MQTMKALRAFRYGCHRRVGDVFIVMDDRVAAVFKQSKLAVAVADEGSVTDEVSVVEPEAVASPEPQATPEVVKRKRGRPKGTYKRKDLVAE